ncbi:hypothetical protein ACQI4L_08980 [Mycolicibacterium litorale]|uniref:hypothetical protein n=1 Tax=Mycolicibacterium litorale TaxID=758802 RepID=UPI003CE6797B
MADELVQCTTGGWMRLPLTHCPNGHQLGPGRVLVGNQPCGTHNGHTTWTCLECDATEYRPHLGSGCRVLNGPAPVRISTRRQ